MLNPILGPMISSARSTDGNPSESWTPELQGPFWLQEGRWVDSAAEARRSSVSWTHSDLPCVSIWLVLISILYHSSRSVSHSVVSDSL